jgi:hypothetical protein
MRARGDENLPAPRLFDSILSAKFDRPDEPFAGSSDLDKVGGRDYSLTQEFSLKLTATTCSVRSAESNVVVGGE